MRLDRRFSIVLSASLLWALMVSALFYRLAAGAGQRRSAGPQRLEVVASKPLPVGASIARDSVRLREVPENLFPAGAFARLEDVVDRPVISPIQPDEPVYHVHPPRPVCGGRAYMSAAITYGSTL